MRDWNANDRVQVSAEDDTRLPCVCTYVCSDGLRCSIAAAVYWVSVRWQARGLNCCIAQATDDQCCRNCTQYSIEIFMTIFHGTVFSIPSKVTYDSVYAAPKKHCVRVEECHIAVSLLISPADVEERKTSRGRITKSISVLRLTRLELVPQVF